MKPARPEPVQRLGPRPAHAAEDCGTQPDHPATGPALPSDFVDALRLRLRQVTEGKTIRTIAAETEMCPETVRRYLNGSVCSVEFIGRMCARYGVDADWLLFGRGRVRRSAQSMELITECGAAGLLGELAHRWEQMELRMIELSRRLDAIDSTRSPIGSGRSIRIGDPDPVPERPPLFIKRPT